MGRFTRPAFLSELVISSEFALAGIALSLPIRTSAPEGKNAVGQTIDNVTVYDRQ